MNGVRYTDFTHRGRKQDEFEYLCVLVISLPIAPLCNFRFPIRKPAFSRIGAMGRLWHVPVQISHGDLRRVLRA